MPRYPVKFSQLVITNGCRVRRVTRTNTTRLPALVETLLYIRIAQINICFGKSHIEPKIKLNTIAYRLVSIVTPTRANSEGKVKIFKKYFQFSCFFWQLFFSIFGQNFVLTQQFKSAQSQVQCRQLIHPRHLLRRPISTRARMLSTNSDTGRNRGGGVTGGPKVLCSDGAGLI